MKHKLQSLIKHIPHKSGLFALRMAVAMAFSIASISAWADCNADGSIGIYLNVNGGKTWYTVYEHRYTDATFASCADQYFNNSSTPDINDVDLGTVTSLYLDGIGAVGWMNDGANNWVAAQVGYKINSGSYSYKQIANYTDASKGKTDELCRKDNAYGMAGYTGWGTTVNLLTGLAPGEHSVTFKGYSAVLWKNGDSNGRCRDYERSEVTADFTVPGWTTGSGTYSSFATIGLGSTDTKDITLGTHYGSTTTATASLTSGHTSDFEVVSVSASTIRVKFKPTAGGSRSAVITITDAYSKTRTLTVSGTAIAPTILIAKNESVDGSSVTLNGYVKYNGCKTITDYGFVYSASNSTPTLSDTKVQVGTDALTDGTAYSETFTEGVNNTYYYRPYMVAGGTAYYSTEVRTFRVNLTCDVTAVTAFIDGGSTASVAFDDDLDVSDAAALTSTTNADAYLWSCTSANSDHATIVSATSRETTVTVDAEGTYTFQLGAKCTGDADYTDSGELTMYVCVPATSQTLLLDGYTANVLCEGETAVASCISETGYTYTLYGPNEVAYGALTGNGSTLQWRNVAGEGTFSVKAAPSEFPNCFVNVGTATQTYNVPFMKIDVNPGLSVISYKAVTLSKNSDSDTDGDFIWEITSGSETSYLLHPTKELIYDGRAREDVEFKGGAGDSAVSYTVTATGTKIVTIGATSDTKSCDATESVTISVSPATAGSCD